MTESNISLPLENDPDEARASGLVAAHTLGGALREAREARGLSVDEVARIIRFSPRQIEAMENNDFGKLPGLTVIRGFIRSYAKLLKLDDASLLAQFDRQVPPEVFGAPTAVTMTTMATLPRASGQGKGRAYLLLTAAFCLVAFIGFGLFHFFTPLPGSSAVSPEPAINASVSQTAPASSYVPPSAIDTREALLSPSSASPVSAPPVLAQGSVVPGATSSGGESASGASGVAASSGLPATVALAQLPPSSGGATAGGGAAGRSLRFDFEESAWVEVRDASKKMLMAQNNLPGTQQVVTGQPPFSIVIGNAAHVRLHYGEQSIDLQPWTRVDVARLTLE